MARIWKILFLLFAVSLTRTQQVYASEEEVLQLEVSYGLSGEEARYGRYCTFTVWITNLGEEMEGTLQLSLASGRIQGGVRYQQPISLAAKEKAKFDFQIKTDSDFTMYQVSVLSLEEKTVAEYEAPLRIIHYDSSMQLGILGEEIKKVKYLEDFGNLLFQLDENNLPKEKYGLDTLDILLVDAFDDSKLSKQQLQAVQQWIEAGGLLILGAGAKLGVYENTGKKIGERNLTFNIGGEEVRTLREAVNSYEETRSSILLELEEKEKNATIDFPLYIGKSMLEGRMLSDMKAVPITKEIFELAQSNTEICLREDTLVLAVQTQVGKGKVLFLAYSLKIEESVWTAAQTWLTRFFMDEVTKTGKQRIDSERYGYFDDYWVQEVMETASQERIPSIGKYFIIFLVYLLVVSPLLYWVLSRLDQTKYLWGAVPAIAFFFTFIVYYMGGSTRVKEPFYGYFDVEVFNAQTKTADGTLDFYVELPNNQGHSFSLEDNIEFTVKNSSSSLSYYNILYNDTWLYEPLPIQFDAYTNCIARNKEKINVTIGNLPAFTKTNYEAAYTAEYEEIPSGEIFVDAAAMEGTITNLFPFDLENAVIYSNHLCIDLGMIEKGETVSFTAEKAFNVVNDELVYYYQELPPEQYQALTAKRQRELVAMKYMMLELSDQKGSYLLGFSKEITQVNPLSKVDLGTGSYGTTLVLVPIKENYTSKGQQFVPTMDSYMEVVDGTLEQDNFRYIMTESLVTSYHLPKEEDVTKILLTPMLNKIPKTESTFSMAEEVYFFNLTSESYDFVFRCSLEDLNSNQIQEISGEQLKNYLNDSNEIKVKFVNTSLESNCILPYLSYYKKE